MKDKYYYKDGSVLNYRSNNKILHRENGPAIEYANGYKAWYINDKLHRENGPAVEYADGEKRWYINDRRHREDGPAIEKATGDKFWFIDGVEYSKEEYKAKLKQVNNMSDIEKATSPEWWIRRRVKQQDHKEVKQNSNQ